MSDSIEARGPVRRAKLGVCASLLGCALLSLAVVLGVIFFPYEKGEAVFFTVLGWLIEGGAWLANWAYDHPAWVFGVTGFATLFCYCASCKRSLGKALNRKFEDALGFCGFALVALVLCLGFVYLQRDFEERKAQREALGCDTSGYSYQPEHPDCRGLR